MDLINKENRSAKAYKLGCLSLRHRKFTEALAHFCVVGTLLPQESVRTVLKRDVLLAFEEYVNHHMKRLPLKDALPCCNQVNRVFPDFEEIPHKIGCLFYEIEDHEMATHYLEKSLAINPCFTPAMMCLENISNYLIERWHFRMLNDQCRNSKYQLALKKAIASKQLNVLDIGTGTGLLSIFAAQAGAKNVFACDASSTMCDICENVVKTNKLENRVTVINKLSMNLKVGTDIPSRVSLLVSEIFDAGLFGEGILTTLKHAWSKLLLNGNNQRATVIPHAAKIHICLIQCQWISKQIRVHKSFLNAFPIKDGFSILCEPEFDDPYSSDFLAYIPGGYSQLSEPQELLSVDFNKPKEINELLNGKFISKDVQCIQSGNCDAVALWFDLKLDNEISIVTSPGTNSCWEQAVFPIRDNLVITPSSKVTVEFLCKDMLRLLNVKCQGNRKPCRKLLLPPNWIRKLNDEDYCRNLEQSVKEALSHGARRFIDASSIPLGGILAAKLGADEVVFTEDTSSKWVVNFTREFGIPLSVIHFNSITKVTESDHRYDALIFDAVDQSGMLVSSILQDLALLRSVSLKSDCIFIPHKMSVMTTLIESPVICDYTKVNSDHTLIDLGIAELMNKYKTRFFEEFRLESVPHKRLCDTLKVAEIDFGECAIAQFSSSVSDVNVHVQQDGLIDAIPYWFEFHYSEGTVNSLTAPSYCHAAVLLDHSIPVTKGETITLKPSYKHSIVFFNVSKH